MTGERRTREGEGWGVPTLDLAALQRAEEEAVAAILRALEEEPARLAALVESIRESEEAAIRSALRAMDEEAHRLRALMDEWERKERDAP